MLTKADGALDDFVFLFLQQLLTLLFQLGNSAVTAEVLCTVFDVVVARDIQPVSDIRFIYAWVC